MNELIQSIASLWKLIAILFVAICLIIYRDAIKTLIMKRDIRIKKGDAEVEVKGAPADNISLESITKEQIAASANIELEVKKEEIQEGIVEPDAILVKLFDAFTERNKEKMKVIHDEMWQCEKDDFQRIRDRAMYLHLLYLLGDSQSLGMLQDMADEYKNTSEVYSFILKLLGFCYDKASMYDKAREIFLKAALSSKDEVEKANNIILGANCFQKLSKTSDAVNLILANIKAEENKNALFIYFTGLSDFYTKSGNKELSALALENALEYNPNNEDTIFNLAYAYMGSDIHNDVCIFHYNSLLEFNPNNFTALNNIGVAYSKVNLDGYQVRAYKKSLEQEYTLAGANLAYLYIEKGFYDEAEAILKEVSGKEDVHINVSKAKTYLEEAREKEETIRSEMLKKAIIKQKIIREYSKALFEVREDDIILGSKWHFKEKDILEIKQAGKEIEGNWVEDEKPYKFKGTMINRAIKAIILKSSYNYAKSEYEFKEDGTAYVYASSNLKKLSLFRLSNNDTNKIIEFELFE